jgi:hypothetical protein
MPIEAIITFFNLHKFLIGLGIGIFIGAWVGMFIIGLVVASRER